MRTNTQPRGAQLGGALGTVSAGTLALLLHFADDEDHARRAWGHMQTWEPSSGWGLVDDAKRAVEETRG